MISQIVDSFYSAYDGAGLEAFIVGASCIFFMVLSHMQASKTKKKTKGVKEKHIKSTALHGDSVGKPSTRPLTSYSQSSVEMREKLAVATARSGRTLRQAVQGLERYKALVWQQGAELTNRFNDQQARSYYVNLVSCVVQVGAESLPSIQGISHKREEGTAGWIRFLLADMRKFGFSRDSELYLIMMKMFANENLWKEVLLFHKEVTTDAIELDNSLLICFMNAAVAVGDAFWALHYFRALARLAPPTQRTYMTVLRVYMKQNDWHGAVKLCEEMETLGSPPDNLVLNQVLGLCVSQGQTNAAETLLNQWEGIIDVISCNTVLKGFTQSGALPECEAMLKRMLSKGPAPNLITFNTIMDCSFRALQALEATGRDQGSSSRHRAQARAIASRPWALLDQLTEFGLEPDRYTCSTIVKGMHLAGGSAEELDRAICLLKRLGLVSLHACSDVQGGASRPKNLHQNTRLVEVIFNTLLDICSSSQDLDHMVEIFDLMQKFEVAISAVTFGTLIKAFGQARRINRCHDVWQQMRDSKTAPTVVTFGCYIDACIRNKELSRAERIFDSMSNDRIKPNAVVYTSLIRGLASDGQPARAFALYRQMRSAGVEPTSVTFNSVLDMVARQLADPKNLQEVINDLQSVTSSKDATAYCILIKTSCNSGNLDNALTLWRQLRFQGITFDEGTFNIILLSCARADRVSEVEGIFYDMRQLGIMPNNAATCTIIKMYGRTKLPHKALEMLDIIENSKGERPNLQVYTCLIQTYSMSRAGSRSSMIFERMLQRGYEPDALVYDAVINSCLHANEFEHAMILVRHASMLPLRLNGANTGSPRHGLAGLPLSRPVSLQPETFKSLQKALQRKEQHAHIEELSTIMKQQ